MTKTKTMTTVNIPGSKSIAARALVCRLLGGHDTVLTNLPDCGDTRGMLRLTDAVRNALTTGSPVTVDIGEGGTTLRFGMAACASIPGLDITLKGSRRLMERPHATLEQALREIGADLTAIPEEDSIRIRGSELRGGVIELDGSVSSQYLSALMLAAPTWKTDTRIILHGQVVSRPYIEMTAGVMRAFGADVSLKSQLQLEVHVRATGYAQCARYDIEGDWSGASYFFELRLIADALGLNLPPFELPTLKSPAESLQGDSRVAAIFADASRLLNNDQRSTINNQTIPHNAQRTTHNIQLDLNDAPDLVPAVAVGLCVSALPFRIEGVAHLRHKESDRMAAIACELRRLGFVLTTGNDTMAWDGQRCEPEPDPVIRTYQDHRMAMAFAPARLAFPDLRIEDPPVVEKSFPDFWNQLSKVMIHD